MAFDFRQLAQEAARSVYDPRAARCWPWSHAWTMWAPDQSRRFQARRCTKCGKTVLSTLADECAHRWKTVAEGRILDEDRNPVGTFHNQQCQVCGDMRKVKLI